MKFDAALENIADNIKRYRKMKTFNGDELLVILQQITGTLFYLEGQRSEAYLTWTKRAYDYIKEGEPISKAEKMADIDVPELYMLRHTMKAAYENVGAIRTTLSNLRSEKQNIQ